MGREGKYLASEYRDHPKSGTHACASRNSLICIGSSGVSCNFRPKNSEIICWCQSGKYGSATGIRSQTVEPSKYWDFTV